MHNYNDLLRTDDILTSLSAMTSPKSSGGGYQASYHILESNIYAQRPCTERARSKRPWIVNVDERARESASVEADAEAGEELGEVGDDGDEEKWEEEGEGVGSGKRDEMSLSVRLVYMKSRMNGNVSSG